MKTVRIFCLPFDDVSYVEAVHKICNMMHEDRAHHIVLANAHTLNFAYSDIEYLQCLQRAAMVLRDGIGVKLASILVRHPLQCNFVGTDFVPHLLNAIGHKTTINIFLFGSKPGVARAAGQEIERRYPYVRVVGVQHGYLPRETWDDVIVSQINGTRPHILLVALGNPLQEEWIARNLAQLQVKVAIGVGALFDYLAGEVSRAPRWMRRIGCEWLYRLLVEPRRMWRRYLIGNWLFLYRVVLNCMQESDDVQPRSANL